MFVLTCWYSVGARLRGSGSSFSESLELSEDDSEPEDSDEESEELDVEQDVQLRVPKLKEEK